MCNLRKFLVLLFTAGALGACSATQHVEDVRAGEAERVTVGTVQKEIKLGMSGAEVASVLGSPNIVTTDSERRETWVYDKMSTEVAYSKSGGSVVGLIFSSAGGGLGGGYGKAGATSTSQRTLTAPCAPPVRRMPRPSVSPSLAPKELAVNDRLPLTTSRVLSATI